MDGLDIDGFDNDGFDNDGFDNDGFEKPLPLPQELLPLPHPGSGGADIA